MQRIYRTIPLGLISILAGCGSSSTSSSTSTTTAIPVPAAVQSALSGYKISVFAQNPTGSTNPDDIVQNGNHVFIGYQDSVNPDGTAKGTAPTSGQVIEYDLSGNIVHTFTAPGHIDGLLAYDSNTLWVSADEDGNPQITVINLGNNTQLTYTPDVSPLPHGGGIDDMKMVNGQVYISASAPTPTPPKASSSTVTYSTDANGSTALNGINSGPALYTVTLNSDGKTFHYVTALMSGSTATQLPGNTSVTLNMTDADSSAIDPAGDFVIDSQGDSEVVFIHNPGSTQTVSVLPVSLYSNPWPIDDMRWVPSIGNSPFMLVSDTKAGIVYRIDASAGFAAGYVYAAGQGSILQMDPTSGDLTPIFVGLNAPHGLNFITQ